ncbi:mitogen-activated protein kinase kinase kinase 7-like isoform X2 [Drosophila innubila]|uniref:mitogen-activated protein kinase kinase kinase 7-like isoform X2 n=1 Tax=Drosophila innubila TaxID=198719 RepID=UPI00148DDE9D|nr:mitogen-activated protein kinase kinase kinase 7-like isoform X2 [Drosophila innubila]
MSYEVDINVDIKELILLENIGFGSFGDVYTANCPTKFGYKIIAVKKLRHSQDSIKYLERELIILSRLKHPNIVTLYGISKDQANRFHILLEYSECGSLYNLLHNEQYTVLDICRPFWMLQCAKGIAYLHERNIIHRDLKTENILLFNKFRTLKLCDFGTVKEIASNNTGNTGTPNYMAPEVANGEKYDTKCDVYSFGIIFWEVMSRQKPFYHLGDIHPVALQKKVAEGIRPPMNDIQNLRNLEGIEELIEKCWHMESMNRPTIQQVLKKLKTSYGYIEFEDDLFNVEILETNDSLKVKDLILQVPSTIKKIPRQDIILEGKYIGIGAFGDVHKAKWRTVDDEKRIAAKRYRYLGNVDSYLERELKYISSLNHENIITIHGISVDNDYRVLLLYEYANCGSLDNLLHGNKEILDYSYIEALNWMHQLVKGMAYMHDRNIVHRNLKPSKLLFVHNFRTVKICSSSCMTEVSTQMTFATDIAVYMAPEVFNGQTFTKKCDVYSFGIILWEVMSRKRPFENKGNVHIHNLVLEGSRPDLNDANIFDKNSISIKNLISKCWNSDPQERPTMNDLTVSLGNGI